MNTTTIFAVAALLFSTSVLVSCEKDGDTTKPVIELTEPEDVEEFLPGSEICVEMDLSDDVALASFKINVHNAFNGHTHDTDGDTDTHTDTDTEADTDHDHDDNYNTDTESAFYYNMTSEELGIDVSGLRNSHQHIHVEIPELAAYGDYHIMVYCYDTSGNESYVARSIAITDDADEHEHDGDEE
ncbi:MAG: DUF4625 domain-containing protein [Rikenellaceae bacterium]